MKKASSVKEYTICTVGARGAGKTALVIQFAATGTFVPNTDPDIEDSFRKCSDPDGKPCMLILPEYNRLEGQNAIDAHEADFFLLCHDINNRDLSYVSDMVAQIRRCSKYGAEKLLPMFFVACKSDSRDGSGLTREELVRAAASHGAVGYYENSAKTRNNVTETFYDAIRCIRKSHAANAEQAPTAKKEKPKGAARVLPWNWGKKAEWDSQHQRLAFTAPRNPTPVGLSDAEIARYRFPPPEVTKNPVAFYRDIATLLESEEGRACADVYLRADNSPTKLAAHRIVLSLRCKRLRDLLAKTAAGACIDVPGVATDEALTEAVRFLYSNELRVGLTKEVLSELSEVSNALASQELKAAVNAALVQHGVRPQRALESSEAVQREMQPAISELKDLADVEVVVEKQPFRLHRAILVARCQWLRALLAERWQRGEAPKSVEVTSMSADIFGVVIEFIYTGRAHITEEIAIDVLCAADMLGLPRLTQLAEMALQPTIDAGSAVAVCLAALHCNAKQLHATCVYWMSVEYDAAQRSEQWGELPAAVQESVKAEHERLMRRREMMKEERTVMQQMTCLYDS